jgi:hypothetical protein
MKPDRIHLRTYQPWFYAAAIYNLAWGVWVIADPDAIFRLLGMEVPTPTAVWQAVGAMVLVWAPAYWWVASAPERHAHFIVVALLGKVIGPLGFLAALVVGSLPLTFGLVILANDVVWWPAFVAYLRTIAAARGGWRPFLAGG